MNDWCTPTADAPSFETVFSRLRLPPPVDLTKTTKTKDPTELDISISGSQLHGFGRLSIEDLKLSNDHTLEWATDRLRAYGPSPNPRYSGYWDPRYAIVPRTILSEQGTTAYLKASLIEPAIAAAVFIRAQHLGLTAAQGAKYPDGNWDLIDCSTTGPGSGWADHALVRFSNVRVPSSQFVAVMEFKTWHVCQSNGDDMDGQHAIRIPVIEHLQDWLERKGGYITMDPPDSLPRPSDDFNWYQPAWQKKIQKILFQCWHATVKRGTSHCVLANEREFILLLRSGSHFRLSKRYSSQPSTPEDTLEMMTHLSYFFAHALCERFPSNDHDLEAPAWPSVNQTALDTVLSQSMSPANQGTSRTHAKTDSQATMRGTTQSTMMRFAKNLVPFLNRSCSASSVTFNLMGCSSPPLAIRVVHGQPTNSSFPKQRSTIVLSHAVQWGDQCHVFRGQFGSRPIVAKICSDRAKSSLREEYAIYQTLRDLQGSAIPRCYGLFRVGDFADMLLLEDCGESLHSYDGLTLHQRASLLSHVSEIHRRHVSHQDLEPRNIVMTTSGQLRVVDFELSDRFHQCIPQDCHELQSLAWETHGSPLKDVAPNRHLWLVPATVVGVMAIAILYSYVDGLNP